jgi:hypothetical protein
MGTVKSGETEACIFTGKIKVLHCEFYENSAYVCSRPLQGAPFGIKVGCEGPTTWGGCHKHIFFGKKVRIPLLGDREWDNIGFGPKGLFEEANRNGYECKYYHYNLPQIIKSIEFTLANNGYKGGDEYSILQQNCQDFVADVLKAYEFPSKYLEDKTRELLAK